MTVATVVTYSSDSSDISDSSDNSDTSDNSGSSDNNNSSDSSDSSDSSYISDRSNWRKKSEKKSPKNSTTQIVMKLKLWWNTKTKMFMKLKNSNCDQT